MATAPSTFNALAEARRQAWTGRAIAILVLLSGLAALWFAATYHTTVLKKEAPVSMLMPVQAPPPPPPPKEENTQDAATATPLNQLVTPQAQSTHDNAITENAEAQIGGDAYGIGSGSGEGTHGSGVPSSFNRGPYALYMAKTIARAVEADKSLAGRLSQLSIRIWVSPAGKITRVELATSTGTPSIDQALQEVIKTMPAFAEPPPQSILDSLPVEMTVKVHRT
jgi:periplasmic protein TonB